MRYKGFAFYSCSSLRSVILPSSVTRIVLYAFTLCPNMTQIFIPASIIFIGKFAFKSCKSLTSNHHPGMMIDFNDEQSSKVNSGMDVA